MSNQSQNQPKKPNRREFIDRSGKVVAVAGAAAVAGPAINALGANDTIQAGVIGPGKRGRYLMDQTYRMSAMTGKQVEFIAVADIFEGWREEGIAKAERVSAECKGYADYRELLDNNDVQAVIIATPEHLHAAQAIDTINAGKDLYLEKPMVHTIQEGKDVVAAAEASDVVIQVGTQRRSVPLFYEARDLIKQGVIGQVTYCEGWWNRNFKTDDPNPAWRYPIPEDATAENIDWEAFLGPVSYTPFNLERYFHWRCYWEFSNGIGSDLMVHQMDALSLVMDVTMPKSVVSSGGIYRWKDGRTTPDTWSSVFEYDEGFQINYHARFSNTTDNSKQYGIKVYGTDGTIEIDLHHKLYVIPEESWLRNKDVEPHESQFEDDIPAATNGAVIKHIENWVDCMHSRNKQTNCDARTGYYGSAIADMSVISYKLGKRVMWDKDKEEAFT